MPTAEEHGRFPSCSLRASTGLSGLRDTAETEIQPQSAQEDELRLREPQNVAFDLKGCKDFVFGVALVRGGLFCHQPQNKGLKLQEARKS